MNARLALKLRVAQETRGHARVALFVGADDEHFALAGHLTFRQDEWALLRPRFGAMANENLLVVLEQAPVDPRPSRELERITDVAVAHLEHLVAVPGCQLCAASLAELV